MTPDSIYFVVFISLLTISTARGNYGYGQQYGSQICDKNIYNRAKEMIRLEMQQRGRDNYQPNNRPPYDSRYPAMTNSYQGSNNYTNSYLNDQVNDHQCRLMRQAFDDLLIHTPLCESINSYQFQLSSDLIQQSRKFLTQYCERNQGWRYAQCFKRREIVECENNYNYMKQNSNSRPVSDQRLTSYTPSNQLYNQHVTYELCQAFEVFRNCVITNSRTQCYTNDLDYLGTYFVDKAFNAAWSCLPNQVNYPSNIRRTDQNYMNNPSNYPFNNDPLGNNNQLQPYNPSFPQNGIVNPGAVPPFQSIPSSQLNSQSFPLDNQIDRAGGALSGIHAGSVSACIERVRPFESSCLDFLIQRQREARYGRSSTDVQRRICCALFRYRDCLSRVVLERCFDNSRVTVDILMGDRNREITQTCRDITRDQCNGAKNLSTSNFTWIISLCLVLILTKQTNIIM